MQAGNYGIMKAIQKYNISDERKATFFTYAYHWVRSTVSKGLQEQKNFIKIPDYRRADTKFV